MKVPMKIHNTAESMSARGFLSACVEYAHLWKSFLIPKGSNEGRMVDALAHSGDEGRDKLR